MRFLGLITQFKVCHPGLVAFKVQMVVDHIGPGPIEVACIGARRITIVVKCAGTMCRVIIGVFFQVVVIGTDPGSKAQVIGNFVYCRQGSQAFKLAEFVLVVLGGIKRV
ncbi:hypothetical protein D3C87_1427610 [compost metagenome]